MEKNELIKQVLDLQKRGNRLEAIKLLDLFLKDNSESRDIISLLGIILVEDNKFKKAIPYLEESIRLKSRSELVYLALYIAYVKLNNFKKSIKILSNYLDKNPAELFKDTLEELLTDLSNGYALDYKNDIIFYAKKNDIDVPSQLEI